MFPCGTKPPPGRERQLHRRRRRSQRRPRQNRHQRQRLRLHIRRHRPHHRHQRLRTSRSRITQPVSPARLYESRSGDPEYVTVDAPNPKAVGRTPARGIIRNHQESPAAPDVPNQTPKRVFLNVVAVKPLSTRLPDRVPLRHQTTPRRERQLRRRRRRSFNAVLAKIGTNGNVCVYTSADTDLIIDINGYVPGS